MKFTEVRDMEIIKAEMMAVYSYINEYCDGMEYRKMPDGTILGFVTGRGWDAGDNEVHERVVCKYCIPADMDAVTMSRMLDSKEYNEYSDWLFDTIAKLHEEWMKFPIATQEEVEANIVKDTTEAVRCPMTLTDWEEQYSRYVENAAPNSNFNNYEIFEEAEWMGVIRRTYLWVWQELKEGAKCDLDLPDLAGAIGEIMGEHDLSFNAATEHFLEENDIDLFITECWRSRDFESNE